MDVERERSRKLEGAMYAVSSMIAEFIKLGIITNNMDARNFVVHVFRCGTIRYPGFVDQMSDDMLWHLAVKVASKYCLDQQRESVQPSEAR